MPVTSEIKNNTVHILTAFLVFLFVFTALSKFLNTHAFMLALKSHDVLKPIAPALSITIPVLEILVATLLLFPSFRRFALLAAFVLMTAFTAYVAFLLLYATELPCSCGGFIQSLSWKQHLLLNSIVTISSLLAFIWCKPPHHKILLRNKTGIAENLSTE